MHSPAPGSTPLNIMPLHVFEVTPRGRNLYGVVSLYKEGPA